MYTKYSLNETYLFCLKHVWVGKDRNWLLTQDFSTSQIKIVKHSYISFIIIQHDWQER